MAAVLFSHCACKPRWGPDDAGLAGRRHGVGFLSGAAGGDDGNGVRSGVYGYRGREFSAPRTIPS